MGRCELCSVSILLLLLALENAEGEAEGGAGQERVKRCLRIMNVLLVLFDTLLVCLVELDTI